MSKNPKSHLNKLVTHPRYSDPHYWVELFHTLGQSIFGTDFWERARKGSLEETAKGFLYFITKDLLERPTKNLTKNQKQTKAKNNSA